MLLVARGEFHRHDHRVEGCLLLLLVKVTGEDRKNGQFKNVPVNIKGTQVT